jgi:hypothetical protein
MLNYLKKIDNAIQRFTEVCPTYTQNHEGIKTKAPLLNEHYPSDLSNLVYDTVCINDVSGSMGEKDCLPSRLAASKKAVEAFMDKRLSCSPNDRFGLIKFNNDAEIVLGLTAIINIELIKRHLDALNVGGGTDIAEGLKAAERVFAEDNLNTNQRLKHILLLTDGCGGNPIKIAEKLKEHNILIEVIGIGGYPLAVNEELLKKVATTDSNGFTHYWFFRDTQSLISHYESLATGIVFRGK